MFKSSSFVTAEKHGHRVAWFTPHWESWKTKSIVLNSLRKACGFSPAPDAFVSLLVIGIASALERPLPIGPSFVRIGKKRASGTAGSC